VRGGRRLSLVLTDKKKKRKKKNRKKKNTDGQALSPLIVVKGGGEWNPGREENDLKVWEREGA